jgi:hypothetical protein
MASLELSECAGCGLLKKVRLSCTAISVGGAELAHKTIVCASCSQTAAKQSRAGELQPVQLRATESRIAARHALQTCAPGTEQRKPRELKRRSELALQQEALMAFEDSLAEEADEEADEEAEEGKRCGWRRSLKAPANRQTLISSGRHPPRRRRSASICGCSMERPA